MKEGEIKGRHVFIVDDLVKTGWFPSLLCNRVHFSQRSGTGGTLIECKNGLYRLGAAKVSAFVTHAVFPLESWKRFTEVRTAHGSMPVSDLFPHSLRSRSSPSTTFTPPIRVLRPLRPSRIRSHSRSSHSLSPSQTTCSNTESLLALDGSAKPLRHSFVVVTVQSVSSIAIRSYRSVTNLLPISNALHILGVVGSFWRQSERPTSSLSGRDAQSHRRTHRPHVQTNKPLLHHPTVSWYVPAHEEKRS